MAFLLFSLEAIKMQQNKYSNFYRKFIFQFNRFLFRIMALTVPSALILSLDILFPLVFRNWICEARGQSTMEILTSTLIRIFQFFFTVFLIIASASLMCTFIIETVYFCERKKKCLFSSRFSFLGSDDWLRCRCFESFSRATFFFFCFIFRRDFIFLLDQNLSRRFCMSVAVTHHTHTLSKLKFPFVRDIQSISIFSLFSCPRQTHTQRLSFVLLSILHVNRPFLGIEAEKKNTRR